MKMQSKILTLALLPLVAMSVIIVVLSNAKINSVVSSAIENGLRASAVAVRDSYSAMNDGDYNLNTNGQLCKGDYIITKNTKIADNLKETSNTDITVFWGSVRYMTSIINPESGNRMVGTSASQEVIEQVLNQGGEMFSTNVDIYGQHYFGYYIPIYNADNEKPVGMIFAGMPQADARAQIMSIISLVICIIVTIGILCAVVLFFVIRKLVKELQKGSAALEELAQGNLQVALDERTLKRKDEIGSITRSIERLKQDLIKVISTVKNKSDELNNAAGYLRERTVEVSGTLAQVETAVGEVAEGATSQAEETQSATENVVHIGNMVEETAKEAEEMHASAQSMRRLGEEAVESLHELQKINNQACESIDIIYEQTNHTNQSVQKIQEATSLITSIAEETNLLSLNASIEAARAGEQGRGFAVVASQIQKLAEQSNESAAHIEEIISFLMADSGKAVETMDVVKDIMQKQNDNMDKTNTRFTEVINGIEGSIDAIERIAGKTEDMDTTRVSVVDTVQGLTAIAEENAASTQETSASITQISAAVAEISNQAEQLKGIADEMNESMGVFKL